MQPYKDELRPHWGFKNESVAEEAVEALRGRFDEHRDQEDVVGMDMVRKDLEMGLTRAMGYAKDSDGKKYNDDGAERTPKQWVDPKKRAAAIVVREA